MALSLSNFLVTLLLLLPHGLLAATIEYDWNITWVQANPDGMAMRPVMGINNQWPLPQLNFTKGDQIIARVTNLLGNQSTSVHFHGFFQNGTNEMDGPVGVNQCGIAPGSTFIYNFTVTQSGTYWYHSHARGQYPDGLRQMLVIADPENPLAGQYDEEVAFTLSDWYHEQMPSLISSFISVTNPTGAEPVPNSALMNDTQNFTVGVEAGKTYLFRLANVGAFAGQYFWIEGHEMKVVEVDGVFTEGIATDLIYLSAAQRYSVLVTAKNTTDTNFPMMASMDTDLFDTIPDGLNWNVTGWLVYDKMATLPAAAEVEGTAAFNDISYVPPKVPTLYTVLSSGDNATNAAVYGTYTNSFVLNKDEIVEIVLNNDDAGRHPFHLHGHNFQVVQRAEDNAGHYDASNHTAFPPVPMRRDVLMVRPQSNFVIRFKADNPGVWLFHCHIEWHMDSGLIATMVEAPLELQQSLTLPANHLQVCKDSKTLTAGNAAGNTINLLDLKGQPSPPGPIPAGFTAKGIVALVFSIISALIGMGFIGWYGAMPIGKEEETAVQQTIAQMDNSEKK
ncbi:hypothetical protein MBLNU457_g0135t2 [Dothideomycetes sp. NU457]